MRVSSHLVKYIIRKRIFLLLVLLLNGASLCAISIVYSFRIAQITRAQLLRASDHNRHTGVLIFDHLREQYNGTRQNFFGGFSSFIYNKDTFYCRIDGAVAHIHEKMPSTGAIFSGTKTDDLLFTAGKAHWFNDNTVLTVSGLFGVPTHKIYSLRHADFGFGQFGIGVQCDGIHRLSKQDSLIAGGRYVHFFPRRALDPLCVSHRFSVGNAVDLILAHSHIWHTCGIEYGYNVRFPFGSLICPPVDGLAHIPTPVQSAFYFVYKCAFKVKSTPQGLLFYISYAFDHSRVCLANKHILTVFAAWGISF